MIDLSVIIVNYRSWSKLAVCLDSLGKQLIPAAKVIVVDNFSNDGQIDSFKANYPWVYWHEHDQNSGFAKGCNLGASLATTKWLLFLNPDTSVPPDCLSSLVAYCDTKPSFKLIAIKQLNESGKDTYPFGIFPNVLNLYPLFRSIERMTVKSKQSKKKLSAQEIAYPDWISGSFVLLRRVDFDLLQGWDERFWMYCEDIDLSKRAAKLGLDRVLLNSWTCMHAHGGASRSNSSTKILTKAEVIISTHKYIEKHFSGFSRTLGHLWLGLTKFIELALLSPFSTVKRKILVRLIKYWLA